jgi:hypothetical protein
LRAVAAVLMLAAAGAIASPRREIPFTVPRGWAATEQKATPTAAAPSEDVTFELQPPAGSPLRAQLVVYAGRVADAQWEEAATERHQARVKNRVAWGMKAESGPPREAHKVGARRAVRWHDRVGGALGAGEQLMTCVIAGGRLACVISVGPPESHDDAAALADTVLASLKKL